MGEGGPLAELKGELAPPRVRDLGFGFTVRQGDTFVGVNNRCCVKAEVTGLPDKFFLTRKEIEDWIYLQLETSKQEFRDARTAVNVGEESFR